MTKQNAYELGAFGTPSDETYKFIQNLPDEVLQKQFEVWGKNMVALLSSQIENNKIEIESINQGLKD
jgi:hypothetical protein